MSVLAQARSRSRAPILRDVAPDVVGRLFTYGFVHPRLRAAASLRAVANAAAVPRTLRDDDDSGAPWTAGFIKGAFSAPAVLHGAKLFEEPGKGYPHAVLTESGSDAVVGRLFWWPTHDQFLRQLKYADAIEEYEPDGSGLYDRGVAEVRVTGPAVRVGGGEAPNSGVEATALAAFYFQRRVARGSVAVPGGDWLRRHR